jgi:hypothetical protein
MIELFRPRDAGEGVVEGAYVAQIRAMKRIFRSDSPRKRVLLSGGPLEGGDLG